VQCLDYRLGNGGIERVGRHGDEVGLIDRGQVGRRHEVEAGRRTQRGAVEAADREPVRGEAVVGAVDAEHLAQDPEFEHRHPVEGDDSHGTEHVAQLTPVVAGNRCPVASLPLAHIPVAAQT
jgi:hypothetical protein